MTFLLTLWCCEGRYLLHFTDVINDVMYNVMCDVMCDFMCDAMCDLMCDVLCDIFNDGKAQYTLNILAHNIAIVKRYCDKKI